MTINAIRPATILSVLWVALYGVAGAQSPAYGVERQWVKHFALPAGGSVSVENVDGNILVEGWDQAEVEATVAMRSQTAGRLDNIQVAVEAKAGSLAFHTLYPADLEKPVRVDYVLRVPRQVRLEEISTLQGSIDVRSVEGVVRARSLHGDIKGADIAGAVEARALTGNIMVSLRSLPAASRPVNLETINGNVDLLLPARANADLELSTVAGRIPGNLPYEVSSVPGDSTHRARLGEGGAHVQLRTVRGNIRVSTADEEL